ncbi:MAG: acyl-CoA thioesterase [Candidatus Eremiobacteraeota bacterium]|nr:acyl-CoA thioesterase [Candidatus Eremiobacteraeota bacterium]
MTDTPLRAGPEVRDRVRWSDVDRMEIVYFGRYLRFAEAAETEFFRSAGFTYDEIAERFGVWIGRVRLTVDYRAPARLDDAIVCRAELVRLGGSSLTLLFPVDREGAPTEARIRLADVRLTLAALDRRTLRPARLPPPLRAALSAPR